MRISDWSSDVCSSDLVEPAALDGAVTELATAIAAKSPLTLKIGKEAFYRQLDMDLEAAYAYTSEVMTRNMMARDAGEGGSEERRVGKECGRTCRSRWSRCN